MGTCYVYRADVSVLSFDRKFNEYFSLVPKYRQQKIEKANKAETKMLSLGAGVLLHMALAEQGIDDTKLVIREGSKGKPYFENSNWKFSLSHSGTEVMCALCEAEVGCDVEQVKSEEKQLESRIKVAKRFFAPSEYNIIKELVTEKKTSSGFTVQVLNERLSDAFYRIWTLKESVIKTTGLGIFMDLSSFEVNLGNDGLPGWNEEVKGINNKELTKNLRTYELEGNPAYRYAVCIASNEDYDIEVKNILL